MANLPTTDELKNPTIRRAIRGYAVADVEALLARAAERVHAAESEVDGLRTRLRENETRLASALEGEAKVKRAQATAATAAEQALDDAREQADELREACEAEVTDRLARADDQAQQVVAQAREQAQNELTAMRAEHADLVRRLEQLREFDQRYRAAMQAHLDEAHASLAKVTSPERAETADLPSPPSQPPA